ncbi:unnamed protein product [Toxocara canis]|uniref:Uncharacterized protein n=1 Tax=Toxocara canis TaxID=6265 RepID=A0A183VGW6_TOXCA|nr:unnamed protein product [Toxocara canis]
MKTKRDGVTNGPKRSASAQQLQPVQPESNPIIDVVTRTRRHGTGPKKGRNFRLSHTGRHLASSAFVIS